MCEVIQNRFINVKVLYNKYEDKFYPHINNYDNNSLLNSTTIVQFEAVVKFNEITKVLDLVWKQTADNWKNDKDEWQNHIINGFESEQVKSDFLQVLNSTLKMGTIKPEKIYNKYYALIG
jgi:hypothetical protein